jgi:hypothetical protein
MFVGGCKRLRRPVKKLLCDSAGIRSALALFCQSTSPSAEIHTVSDAIISFNGKDIKMRNRCILMLCFAVITLSTSASHAGPCTREIDREWAEVGTKIQARIGAGRSYIQGTVGLLHHQPTPSSVAAAVGKVGNMWIPLETTVIALARAREADDADDAGTCKEALIEARRATVR